MAPRTRSDRAANLAKEKTLANGGTFNTEGYLSLPAEIHLEILTHFPVMSVPNHEQEQDDIDGLNTRHQTVSALSQTCRALRHIFLGQVWKRIEVFDGMQTPKGPLPKTFLRIRASVDSVRLKLYAEELIRQLEIVTIREPGFAQYVQVVNVVITPYSMKAVLNELAKALAILPNLHTVQLNLSTGQGLIPGVFRNQHYPQIRTLSLTMPSLAFADYCPEARVIVPYLSHCFVAYPRNSPGLEVLGVTSLYRKNDPSHLKNLRDISVVTNSPASSVKASSSLSINTAKSTNFQALFDPLRLLPYLDTIRLRIDKEGGQTVYSDYAGSRYPVKIIEQCEVDKRIQYAREVLAQTKGDKSSKKIVVTYEDGRVETLHL